jgi:hypothetical protein
VHKSLRFQFITAVTVNVTVLYTFNHNSDISEERPTSIFRPKGGDSWFFRKFRNFLKLFGITFQKRGNFADLYITGSVKLRLCSCSWLECGPGKVSATNGKTQCLNLMFFWPCLIVKTYFIYQLQCTIPLFINNMHVTLQSSTCFEH